MKKYFFSFAAVIMLLSVCSCNKDAFMDVPSNATTRADEKPWDVDFSELDTTYFVSDKDIEAYIHFKKLVAEGEKREFEVCEVVPMGLNDEATLAYLINYNDGWEIIAADKRAPIVLASDEKWNFDLKEVPENIIAWLKCLEEDVLVLRTCKERPQWADDQAWKKMVGSVDFWRCILADADFIQNNKLSTRSFPGTPDIDAPINPIFLGHWELVGTRTSTSTIEIVNRLTDTDFHQEEPYNDCCPNAWPYSGRAVAGCVAIAGAQMAYYLHNHIQMPALAASDGYCNSNAYLYDFYGNVYGVDTTAYHSINITSYNSSIWNSMASIPDSAAFLIADIGKRVHMEYSKLGSGAATDKLVSNYFEPFGVLCRYRMYEPLYAINSIKNSMPVIMDAFDGEIDTLDPTAPLPHGHAFISDGYKKTRSVLQNVYEWVYDVTPTQYVPIPMDSVQTVYTYPDEEFLHMNWGNGASYNGNNAWYSPLGNWTMAGTSYSTNRHLIYNFSTH